MKNQIVLVACCLVWALTGNVQAEKYTVTSPNGHASVMISIMEQKLSYALDWKGSPILSPSETSLVDPAAYTVLGAKRTEIDQTWNPVWGQFSEIQDQCNELTVKLMTDGIRMELICRVYDTGIGLRFSVPEQPFSVGKKVVHYCEYKMGSDIEGYFPRGEGMPLGPQSLSAWAAQAGAKSGRVSLPGVFDLGAGKYMAVLDSDLYSAKPFSSSMLSIDKSNGTPYTKASGIADSMGFVTPWRVILFGDTLGDLLINSVPLNLAAPCEITDTSWIKPGKGLWDWRIHGYDNGDFNYGIDTRSYLRQIDFCAAQGIEYLTIDDHWFTHAAAGKMEVSPKVDLEKVMAYGREKEVGVVLYYDRKKGNFGDDQLFAHYADLGASGIKYGFMGNKAGFTRDSMQRAADEHLFVFYHDGPVPMTGVERTLPNLFSREYCHAQQDSRRAFTPEGFLKMATINALSGPLDQANGNFGIKSINAGERQKGPRQKDSYISTVVSECARTLVIYTGLITLPDAPEEYLKKADLFEFLKQMPATWDETRIINCRMGEYITTARRSGDTWFVGSVNNETARELAIPLDFLTPGTTYNALLFQDTASSHGVKNPEAYEIHKTRVKAGDVLSAKMAVGGGHAMILRK